MNEIPKSKGAFSGYDIEYVYDFLGKERIDKRVLELDNRPTLGTSFREFVERDTLYLNGTGVLYIFPLLLDNYFYNEIDLTLFLYESSKRYNESNYYSGKNTSTNRAKELEFIESMISSGRDSVVNYQDKKISEYWLDYHFFYMYILKVFLKQNGFNHWVDEMIDSYKANFHAIAKIFETNTSKPFNNGFIWSAIMDYYGEDDSRAIELADLNNLYPKVWNPIYIGYEEEEEGYEEQ